KGVEGAGGPTITPLMPACSVVVAGAANVAVLDRCLAGCLPRESLVETVLEDRCDRAVGGHADVVAAPAGGLDARGAVAFDEAQDAEAGAEALLGVGLSLHDRLDERNRRWADPRCLADYPRGRPFRVTAMRARHVLRRSRVPVVQG